MRIRHILILVATVQIGTPHAAARPTQQSAAFTYQGVLKQSNAPVTGGVDLQFGLFDALVAGNQIGATLPVNAVSVVEGVFTSSLDFGSLAFNGQERWLEIAVRSPAGSANPFVTLTPRQKLASAPYAAYALNASLPATYSNPVNFTSALNAFNGVFTGSGFGLTSLNPLALSGLIDSGNIGGTYSNALALSNASNTFNGSFSGSGAALTSLNAANIASGNLSIARMPTGGAWSLSSNLNINSNALVVEQATGEVGIGTAAPGFTFEVARTVAGNINPTVLLRQAGSGSASSIRYQNSAGNHFNLGITAANDFALGYNNNISLAGDLLRISPSGQVGIGSTPEARLHVNMSDTGNPVVLAGAPLMLESMADNWISMMTDAADLSGIAFGRPGATTAEVIHGGIVYNDLVANGMEFRTGGNLTRMVIDAAGNVGMATTTPVAALNVYEPDESTNSANFTQSVTNAGVLISSDYTANAYLPGIFWNTLNDNPTKPKGGIFLRTEASGSSMHLSTSNNYGQGIMFGNIVIDADGQVGVGTSTPAAELDVYGGSSTVPVLNVQGATAADVHIAAGGLGGGLNAGDVHIEGGHAITISRGGDVILDGGDSDNNGAGDVILHAGDSIQSVGGNIVITAGTGSSSGLNGEVLITGRVGIGRDPATANALEVEGTAAKTTAGSWLANSDRRIKTDIETVTSALDTLDQVRLTSFRYTPEYLKAHPSIEDRRYLNVIAQEFAQVFPEHVKGSGEFLPGGEEILQVDIHPLTIYSAAAIQELRAQVRERDARLAAIHDEQAGRISNLESEVAALREIVQQLLRKER